MKTKVCHITTVHLPFDDRIFHKECKTLVEASYEVVLIAQYDREEIKDGVHIVPLPKTKKRLYRMIYLPIKVLNTALRLKADVYHFHDPELIVIGIILKFLGKQVIYDVHEDYENKILSKYYIPGLIRPFLSRAFGFYEKKVSKIFDAIITADNYVMTKFININSAVIRVANFPPICFAYKFDENVNKNKNKFICVYAGGLIYDRGISKIIESFCYLKNPDIELILAGKASSDIYYKIKKIIIKEKRIKYVGELRWDEVQNLLKIANVGLNLLQPVPAYLYAAENSVKIFEYMAAGIPIISSNFPGLKRIIEDECSCGICINSLDPKEIAKAIEYLITHPEEAKKMGENGRRAVLEQYNWEKESEKLIEIYVKLTGGL